MSSSMTPGKEKLGAIGEKIARNFFIRQGDTVIDSIDPYDRRKDFTRNDKLVEIKTLQPYVNKNCFGIGVSQIHKCYKVDELYVVAVPPAIRPDYFAGGKMYFIDKTAHHFTYTTRFGEKMFGIPIKQEAVHLITDLDKEEIDQLRLYTESAYA
tara:strand:- start:736 stop:1197 length:462 start_codon:yes stop_codon:yes gene_type:complete